jgi:hypothetical protein
MKKSLAEIYDEIVEMGYYEKMETFTEMTPYELYRFYYKAKKAHKLVNELDSMIEVAKGCDSANTESVKA